MHNNMTEINTKLYVIDNFLENPDQNRKSVSLGIILTESKTGILAI
jgi:hypothetical protein